jgi:hypothetical protein
MLFSGNLLHNCFSKQIYIQDAQLIVLYKKFNKTKFLNKLKIYKNIKNIIIIWIIL